MKDKKYLIPLLCACIVCFTLFCIYKYEEKHKLSSFYPDTSTIVYDKQMDDLEKEMGIQEEWLYSYHVLSSLFLTSSERIYLFECKKDKVDDVKKACQKQKNILLNQFENTDEKNLILQAKEYYDKDYCILIISKKAGDIMREVKRVLSL